MPGIPLPVAFRVYEHGTTTPIEGVNVGVRNLRTREFRDSDDDNFNLLLTSSVGEGTFNAANFTEEYAIGDEIEITLNHNGLKDKIFITLVSGPMAGIVLTPCPREVYDYERSLDEIGSIISITNASRTLSDDYGSIKTETQTAHPNKDNTYASIQPEEENIDLEEQGEIEVGRANGFFKVRYNISKDDKITVHGSSWRVQNKPITYYYKNAKHHQEAELVKL